VPTEIRQPEFNGLLCEVRFQIPGSSMILPTVALDVETRVQTLHISMTSLVTWLMGGLGAEAARKRG